MSHSTRRQSREFDDEPDERVVGRRARGTRRARGAAGEYSYRANRGPMYLGTPAGAGGNVVADDADIIRACTRKKAYPTIGAAEFVAAKSTVSLRAYACRYCGLFHIGSFSAKAQS